MQTFIFEGIATSGKTTVFKELLKSLPTSLKVIEADEETSHIPIKEQSDDLHMDFFKNLITKLASSEPDLLLIDRFYLTQAFRVKVGLDAYKELEQFLLKFNPTTIFLKVDEDTIPERIQKAMKHRNSEWVEYAKSRGQAGKYVDYYINQQRSQLQLLKTSLVPHRIFDTTNHNYEIVVKELTNFIHKY